MTPMELRSLARGGGVLLLLSLVRLAWDHGHLASPLAGGADNDAQALLEANRAAREEDALRKRPLSSGETVDPNRAGEAELDRLPGVGPGAARAIVEEREGGGGFARPEDLLRVRGIGPATLAKMRPHLDFGGGLPPGLRAPPGRGRSASRGGSVPLSSPDRGGVAQPLLDGPGSEPRVDVNQATPEELESLPGIGPALARRIVESREREGAFHSADDLLRVSGIGPAVLARIRPRIIPGNRAP